MSRRLRKSLTVLIRFFGGGTVKSALSIHCRFLGTLLKTAVWCAVPGRFREKRHFKFTSINSSIYLIKLVMSITFAFKKVWHAVKQRCFQIVESVKQAMSSLWNMVDSIKEFLKKSWDNSISFSTLMGGILISHCVMSICPTFLCAVFPAISILSTIASFLFSISFHYPATMFLLMQMLGFVIDPHIVYNASSDLYAFIYHFLSIFYYSLLLFTEISFPIINLVIFGGGM